MRIKAIKSVLSIINGNARNDNRNAVEEAMTKLKSSARRIWCGKVRGEEFELQNLLIGFILLIFN